MRRAEIYWEWFYAHRASVIVQYCVCCAYVLYCTSTYECIIKTTAVLDVLVVGVSEERTNL